MNYKELGNECKVCFCVGTSLGEIRQAIGNGACSVDEVVNKTEAGTRCRLCKIEASDLNKKRPLHIDKIIESER